MKYAAIFTLVFMSFFGTTSFSSESIRLDLKIPFKVKVREQDVAELKLTEEKVNTLKSIIGKFIESYPQLMQKAYDNGYGEIELAKLPSDENSFTFAIVSPFLGFQISDYFFQAGVQDSVSGYDLREQILLHELIHGIDFDKEKEIQGVISLSEVALDLMGFDLKSCGNRLCPIGSLYRLKNISQNEIKSAREEFYKIRSEKGWLAARDFSRQYALKYGYPTLYTLYGGADEAFAEIVSHIGVDPKASQYLSPSLISWVRKNILN